MEKINQCRSFIGAGQTRDVKIKKCYWLTSLCSTIECHPNIDANWGSQISLKTFKRNRLKLGLFKRGKLKDLNRWISPSHEAQDKSYENSSERYTELKLFFWKLKLFATYNMLTVSHILIPYPCVEAHLPI